MTKKSKTETNNGCNGIEVEEQDVMKVEKDEELEKKLKAGHLFVVGQCVIPLPHPLEFTCCRHYNPTNYSSPPPLSPSLDLFVYSAFIPIHSILKFPMILLSLPPHSLALSHPMPLIIRFVPPFVLFLLHLPSPLHPSTLPSGARNDCAVAEVFFGPCLPGQPRTCPGTCPPGCHCVVDSCCYPRSNPGPSPGPAPGPVPSPSLPPAQPGGGSGDLVTMLLLMLLLRRRGYAGFGYGGFGTGCQDAAWNCFQFAPMCFRSFSMLSYCPRTCGACPYFGGGGLLGDQIALVNAFGNGGLPFG